MARIYYHEAQIAGQAFESEFINIRMIDHILSNSDSRLFKYDELSKSSVVGLQQTERETFRFVELRNDGIFYKSSRGELYLPSAILFYDIKDFNFPSEFYFIPKIGNEVEIRKCNGGEDVEWLHFPELHEAVDDTAIIAKMENTLREIKDLLEIMPKGKNTQKAETVRPDLSESQKNAFKELTDLCVYNQPNRSKIHGFIDNLKDYENDDEYLTTLNFVMDYLDDEEITFIMRLDWKAGVEDLEWQLSSNLSSNYNISADLPKAGNYPENTSVSQDRVFKDFDRVLRKNGLQLGFIDTDSDEYIVLLHKIQDKGHIEKVVLNIGYAYNEAPDLNL